ncbi:hypothetical protein HMPREF9419_1685 [Prevotella nigrescens ATCC 33563]|nr:hypothetical protein HMPREF9419_1685 [Prevotella nigrescens ATCC 33563]
MDKKAHARLTYMGCGFFLLAEYQFHNFMIDGQLSRLICIGVLVIGQSGNTEQSLKRLPVCFLLSVLLRLG